MADSKITSSKIHAVVFGGLNLLRCFNDRSIPAAVIATSPDSIVFHSRYCKNKYVIEDYASNHKRTVDELIGIGKQFSEKPVLYYGNDKLLLTISRNRERLKKYYRFLMPNEEMIEDFVEKTRFDALSRRLNLPVPLTVSSHDITCIEDIEKELTYPILLKPGSHVGWHQSPVVKKETGGQPQKGFVANGKNELSRLYDLMKKVTDDFVIQEYIPGGEELIYSFHAYCNGQSKPLAYFVGKKIRTYPRTGGESCYLELVNDSAVVRSGLEILEKLEFVGPVKLDFKKDIRTNRYCLLEINARYNLWHYLGSVSGINLPKIAYADLTGHSIITDRGCRTDIKWLAFGMDLRSFIKSYHPVGELSWMDWLLSLRGKKIYSLFSWTDPYPFIFDSIKSCKARLSK